MASLSPFPWVNYRSLGLVGHGQFGQVYCAIHRKTGQIVALKHLNRDRLPTRRFLRELRFLLSLQHPNIANCYALEQSETGRQLVLHYCEGGTLRNIMEQEAQLTLSEILTLIAEILSALEHAHNQRIVHCDIKPENILLSLTPMGWQAKVSDFGIARLKQELTVDHSDGTGSPAYMAPERFYHQYAESSDLYAVGIVLYELLLGDRPFSGSHAQLMVAHLNEAVQLPETLPQGVRSLLNRALEKLMARRFHHASEMKAALLAMRQTLTAGELRECFPKPLVDVSISHFHPQQAIPLAAVCQDLSLLVPKSAHPSMLLAALGKSIDGWSLTATGALVNQHPCQQWQLEFPVQQILSTVNGAIAIAHDTLYQLTPGQAPQPITTFSDTVQAVPGYRRWIVVQSMAEPNYFGLVDSLGTVPTIPRLFTTETPQGESKGLLLDDRHFLVADVIDQQTNLHVMTRWGKPLGVLNLQTPLHQLAPSQKPYQFLAQGGSQEKDLLVIYLKPFRVQRCRLGITVDWLGELILGFVGISAAGQMRIVNFQGHLIAQVDHLPAPTAIAFHPPYHVWLTTHQRNTPRLHCIDVRKLDLEIVF
ncbi:MAG: serine/threonine protein kinase [Leptolyngbya sp. SIO1D8]|nr:serine/threonine protein kinase [Leptolyngbya sp. SIO1D8]